MRDYMTEPFTAKENQKESIFLNESFMAAICFLATATGLVFLFLCISDRDYFGMFEIVVKLTTAVSMFIAFRSYKWDVAKGLMGGVLFCLMYQEAHLALAQLWSEQDFNVYLMAGVQGSVYLAAAGMSCLMTVVITLNHFFINYASHGNPKEVIFNRIALIFKFAVYLLLLTANSQLGFAPSILWKNAVRYLTDISLLLLLVSVESQIDSFKTIRGELLQLRKEGKKHE